MDLLRVWGRASLLLLSIAAMHTALIDSSILYAVLAGGSLGLRDAIPTLDAF